MMRAELQVAGPALTSYAFARTCLLACGRRLGILHPVSCGQVLDDLGRHLFEHVHKLPIGLGLTGREWFCERLLLQQRLHRA